MWRTGDALSEHFKSHYAALLRRKEKKVAPTCSQTSLFVSSDYPVVQKHTHYPFADAADPSHSFNWLLIAILSTRDNVYVELYLGLPLDGSSC